MPFEKNYTLPVSALFLILLLLGFAVYYPGLQGSFIFDDFPNLRTLGLNGGVTDWQTFWSFVSGGFSGPTGRPISLVTFLLDANNWPAEPHGFKYTNVLIHLLNGTLVFAITIQILSLIEGVTHSRASWVALVATSLWLLHPQLTSTTLYVVQRMAMLSALFCFAGISGYLFGRVRLISSPLKAYIIMTVAVGAGTLLATFSKENGAVLPLLILCIEATIVSRNRSVQKLSPWWKWGVLIIPSVGLVLYLLKGPITHGWFSDYGTRDFSPYERLLTQSRVVLSYLVDWFTPNSAGGAIYYDNVILSKGIFSPISTAVSLLILLAALTFSIVKRNAFSLVSFVVLFFLSSLIIESTTIGLELKFDHRIYLGSAFIFLPFVLAASNYLSSRALKALLGMTLVASFAGLTYSAASLWGNHQQLTMVWAIKNPNSVRSQTEAAQMLFAAGKPIQSQELLDDAAERIPDDFRLRLTQVLVQCMATSAEPKDLAKVKELSGTGPYKQTDFNLLNSLLSSANSDSCNGLSNQDALEITGKLLSTSEYRSPRALAYAHLHYFHGLALLRSGKEDEAIEVLDKALDSRSSLHMRMNIAAYKADTGLLEQALADALYVEDQLESGGITGKAALEAPPLNEVRHFIGVVRSDIASKTRN